MIKSNSTFISSGLISCIIPVYNRPELIVECVQSVLAQTYDNYEIIIVDDGSTDQTSEVLYELAQQYSQISVYPQENQGPGAARQLGLDHAQGQYVQFLDSDDLILPTKFELFSRAFEDTEQPDIVYSISHYYEIGKPDDYVIWKETNKKLKSILPTFFVARSWGTATPIYRHTILKKAGRILALSCEEDLEFECRIGLQNPKLYFIDEHLTNIRHHSGDRFSINNPNRAKQLSQQIFARKHIYQSMVQFGLQFDNDIMKFFARTMFLLARQAGELGLKQDSTSAFNLAQQAGQQLPAKDNLAMQIFKITHSIAGTKAGSKLFNGVYNRLHKFKN